MSLISRIAATALTLTLLPCWITGQVAGSPSPVVSTGAARETWSTSPAVGLGPLAHSSGSPTSVFRLVYLPLSPTTLPEGRWEVHAHSDWANFYCDGGERYLLDYESLRFLLGAAYGLTSRTQIAVGGTASHQGGGVLDGFIEGFERAIGHPNQDRLPEPRDRYLVRWRDQDGSVHEIARAESGWHVEAVALQLTQRILNGSETSPSLVATGVARIPVGGEAPGRPAGGVDIGASLGLGQRLGRFNLYAALGVVAFGSSSDEGTDLLDRQLSLSTALEYRATPRTSCVLQTLVSSAVARHLGELSKRVREVAVGIKHRAGRDVLIEASVGENVLLFGNSADIAFHAGLVWRPSWRSR